MLMEKEYCLVYLSLSFLTVLSDVIHADALVEMDTYFDGYQFWSLPVNGIGACAIACVRTTMCLSFNFDLTDRKCEMNSQVLENHRDFGRSKRKSIYSNIRNWPPEIDPECFNHNCDIDEVCIPKRLATLTSRSSMCMKFRVSKKATSATTSSSLSETSPTSSESTVSKTPEILKDKFSTSTVMVPPLAKTTLSTAPAEQSVMPTEQSKTTTTDQSTIRATSSTTVSTLSTTITEHSSSSTTTKKPMSLKYIGCFRDKGHPRDLNGSLQFSSTNKAEECTTTCWSQGYKYAAMQNSIECFCGSNYGTYGSIYEARCDYPCPGDLNEKCGGAWANSVYSTGL